ncbi:E3 ubiquitin-protein ligase RNF14-like [Actinia tenebrosa]|uniref:RBR-type E3 ubiquitin transferase n=1 Tax=Actinia tenebrosa TaxID=6105 RepID=A0A6P8J2K6_ACTTE|nr:E3 ubiquitin-protein ligase RNF14-like [Actinia tenebrosa]
MAADQEEQKDELIALTSIYDNRTFIRSLDDKGGQLNAHLDFPKPFSIRIREAHLPKSFRKDKTVEEADELATSAAKDVFATVNVDYLPPIVLNFELPTAYPSEDAPQYTLSCKWLTNFQLSELCKKLDAIWEEQGPGSVILFTWFQFLLDEAVGVLAIESPFTPKFTRQTNKKFSVDERVVQDVASYHKMVAAILNFNETEKVRVFETSNFTCEVCFSEKPGLSSIKFHDCDHVFCNQCASEYFTVQIQSGASKALNCLASKCESQANPSQVKCLVTPNLYEKYEKHLLQSTLDSMPDIMYCPRPNCQSPVILETNQTLASCPQCAFSFCVFCKKTYHGVSPCSIKNNEFKKLQEEYLSASNEEKEKMEKMYGKQKLKNVFEELVSNEWIKANSKKCPSCSFGIEKVDGCNKMTCSRCRSHFCWLCSSILSSGNPYLHFNSPVGGCFGKLFEAVHWITLLHAQTFLILAQSYIILSNLSTASVHLMRCL